MTRTATRSRHRHRHRRDRGRLRRLGQMHDPAGPQQQVHHRPPTARRLRRHLQFLAADDNRPQGWRLSLKYPTGHEKTTAPCVGLSALSLWNHRQNPRFGRWCDMRSARLLLWLAQPPSALLRSALLRTGRAPFNASGSSTPWWHRGCRRSVAAVGAVGVYETAFSRARRAGRRDRDHPDRRAGAGQPPLPVAWGLWPVGGGVKRPLQTGSDRPGLRAATAWSCRSAAGSCAVAGPVVGQVGSSGDAPFDDLVADDAGPRELVQVGAALRGRRTPIGRRGPCCICRSTGR